MKDNVNHPDHYNAGSYECITVMRELLTEEQMKGFCLGNALKYFGEQARKAILLRMSIRHSGILTI